MNKIEVGIINENFPSPAGMMTFLAKLTQRGHKIKNMKDLQKLLYHTVSKDYSWVHKPGQPINKDRELAETINKLPHGTIKRFTPITVAIVGASRRFLSQIRTHSVGLEFVSASLQYSDYSGQADFVVPYEVLLSGRNGIIAYIEKCKSDLAYYESMIKAGYSNDTAGYTMNQALRNILIIQGNHEAWMELIRKRTCHRNTEETAYVMSLVWQRLYEHSANGDIMFEYAGPDCMFGICKEGNKKCSQGTFRQYFVDGWGNNGLGDVLCPPRTIIEKRWPLLCQQ